MRAKAIQHWKTIQHVETYCEIHPRSPSAVRRPRLLKRGDTWVALLGTNFRNGVVGFGPSVEAALRSFDIQYLNALRPPIAEPTLGAFR